MRSPLREFPAACLAAAAIALASMTTALNGQPVATLPIDTILKDRLGVAPQDLARIQAGEAVVWKLNTTVGHEVASAGAVHAKGDLRRFVVWFRDIESFIRATGTVNVGGIDNPAQAANFSKLNFDGVDAADLAACKPGNCAFRMPAAFLERFQKDVDWKAADASARASALARILVAEYATAYQSGGDAALGSHHDQKAPNQIANEFRDILRRETRIWDLANAFVTYLETFPQERPAGLDDRFYWTRDKVGMKPALTLHHVALQEFPDGRVLVADKQFYASRQLDAALLLALAVPTADKSGFTLAVSIRARGSVFGGVTGRVLKNRIDKEVSEGLKMYLDWIKQSAAM